MKKVIAIIRYNCMNKNTYSNQLKQLFSDYIEVVEYFCDDHEYDYKKGIISDIVVAESYEVYQRVSPYIEDSSMIIFAGRTISREGFEKIKGLSFPSRAIILDQSIRMAEQIIALLYQSGIKKVELIPGDVKSISEMHNENIVLTGFTGALKNNDNNIIDIGDCFLDASTLINIGEALGLDNVLSRKNIERGYKDLVPNNIGLTEIIKKVNNFEGQLDILLQITNDGVIGVDLSGNIHTFNDKAENIMGWRRDEILHRNGVNLFSEIPFDHVINSQESIKEKLIKINNYDVIVSVDPIIHSGKLYGAIATVKKFSDEELKQHRLRAQLIGKGHKAKYTFENIIGESVSIKKCKSIAARMAESNSTILITGESGTGKELFAQAIHNCSRRREFQFVAVNCGAIPENLLESELFGYEEGAFTGARKGGKPGLFELAHKGTLFLDEIGEMPMNLQMRLLRVLQEREVMRIGGDRIIYVDIRLIAATNKNLKEMVKTGKFREDLYYRLNVIQLQIPPLRDRKEDIELFLKEFMREFGSLFSLTEEAKKAFSDYRWNGNVRELKNYVEYLANTGLKEINPLDLPFEVNELRKNDTIIDNKESSVLKNIAGRKMAKYLFILEELQKSYDNYRRLGRRSISEIAKENNIYISEREVRNILEALEEHGLIEISKGRMGSVITEYGKRVLEVSQKLGGK